jgi:hypothetical protein
VMLDCPAAGVTSEDVAAALDVAPTGATTLETAIVVVFLVRCPVLSVQCGSGFVETQLELHHVGMAQQLQVPHTSQGG